MKRAHLILSLAHHRVEAKEREQAIVRRPADVIELEGLDTLRHRRQLDDRRDVDLAVPDHDALEQGANAMGGAAAFVEKGIADVDVKVPVAAVKGRAAEETADDVAETGQIVGV
jgi:hypothetical protein